MDIYKLLQKSIGGKLTEKPQLAKTINAICQLEVSGDNGGVWTIDFTRDSDWISVGANEGAKCTLKLNSEDLMALVEGKVTGFELFTSQRLKISGQIALALKLNPILQG